VGGDFVGQLRVLWREGIEDATGKHRDRAAASGQCPAVGGAVNAASHAADDGEAGSRETGGEPLGLLLAVVGGAASADNSDRHLVGGV